MKKLLCFVLLALSMNAAANDEKFHQGKSLHDQKCNSCHQSEVYTRKDRNVKSMSALENQVSNCMKGAAKAEWTGPQTTSVIDYLNERYYKF